MKEEAQAQASILPEDCNEEFKLAELEVDDRHLIIALRRAMSEGGARGRVGSLDVSAVSWYGVPVAVFFSLFCCLSC